jgi:hypothetical protein
VVDVLVGITGVVVDVVKMHNEMTARQRQEIQQRLQTCEWKPWADLREAN